MARIDALCAEVRVRVVPTKRRRRGRETQARGLLKALAAQHGDGHVRFVLRAIVDSEGNVEQLWSETIGAVSDVVLARPDLAGRGLGFMEAFDAIPLGPLRARAQALGFATTTRQALGILLVERLESLLAPAALAA